MLPDGSAPNGSAPAGAFTGRGASPAKNAAWGGQRRTVTRRVAVKLPASRT